MVVRTFLLFSRSVQTISAKSLAGVSSCHYDLSLFCFKFARCFTYSRTSAWDGEWTMDLPLVRYLAMYLLYNTYRIHLCVFLLHN
ncbi:hypothetical protein DFS33DRAFT_360693 [Desarmillaria ectypa]|nr:hypothetical protein DFS33DRAFT_360693 [Desarmillaria ectypa]